MNWDIKSIKKLLNNDWFEFLEQEFEKEYFVTLLQFLQSKVKEKAIIYPPSNLIFNAFNATELSIVRVVILGQDPYHGKGQANGLCFSVNDGIKKPPSLSNIFKEIEKDLGYPIPTNGNLEPWANQGVLLLNAFLTVEDSTPAAHKDAGWHLFTNAVIQLISDQFENVVFVLWGNFAQQKEALIDSKKHKILKAAHPSPFSAHNGFFDCGHFSKCNELLVKTEQKPIYWQIIDKEASEEATLQA